MAHQKNIIKKWFTIKQSYLVAQREDYKVTLLEYEWTICTKETLGKVGNILSSVRHSPQLGKDCQSLDLKQTFYNVNAKLLTST